MHCCANSEHSTPHNPQSTIRIVHNFVQLTYTYSFVRSFVDIGPNKSYTGWWWWWWWCEIYKCVCIRRDDWCAFNGNWDCTYMCECMSLCRLFVDKMLSSYKPQEFTGFGLLGSFMGAIELNWANWIWSLNHDHNIIMKIFIETLFWINNHEAALHFFYVFVFVSDKKLWAVSGRAEYAYFPEMQLQKNGLATNYWI